MSLLQQTKLSRSEWDSIEVPVSSSEKDILKLIIDGYDQVGIANNTHTSLAGFMKITPTKQMENYLYAEFFKPDIELMYATYSVCECSNIDVFSPKINSSVTISKIDMVRINQNTPSNLKSGTSSHNKSIYEYVLLDHVKQLFKTLKKSKKRGITSTKLNEYIQTMTYNYFTLHKLLQNTIAKLNCHVVELCKQVVDCLEPDISPRYIIENSVKFIEQNTNILMYEDITLYPHQKELFTLCKTPGPKLILYTAPTGTGKTITPVSLANAGHRILFVSAGKHVGLALAKSAISMNRKIAFAFGCESVDDIRLHYFSAKEFTTNRKTGGIYKVDNSVGDLVEIMICDIKSFLVAMYYMRSFSPQTTDENGNTRLVDDLIVYWDEPTISMDYETHEYHDIIHENWSKNVISTMILSSATLPKLHELTDTIADFKNKFPDAEVHSIVSHDSKKTIPLINREGYAMLPHHLSETNEEVRAMCVHCLEYLTSLRYMELGGVVEFIMYAIDNGLVLSPRLDIERVFTCLDDITLESIKTYYIRILQQIPDDKWEEVHNHFMRTRMVYIPENKTIDEKGKSIYSPKYSGHNSLAGSEICKLNSIAKTESCQNEIGQEGGQFIKRTISEQPPSTLTKPASSVPGLYITTKDAFTLTDGPTIFITDNIRQISKFYIKQSNIPAAVTDLIMKKIEHNDAVNDKIHHVSLLLEDAMNQCDQSATSSSSSCSNKVNREAAGDKSEQSIITKLTNEINMLASTIKPAIINETFIPNKPLHKAKWAKNVNTSDAFTSDIDEKVVRDIMLLQGVESSWKIMLMLGIGVFTQHDNIKYTEIMKKLADQQKIFMIIASSDYIYGTSYQFCHLYLGKDLTLTQEKIVQALGRVGRKNVQQNYSIRFRCDEHIKKLLSPDANKPEVVNMNKLFNS
jgi:hypothetical protein